VSINTGKQWVTQAIGLPTGMQAVLFIPEFESLTSETRAALPKEIPVADAVFNISRAAMLINSFATDNFEALRYACQDVIHQPYRGAAFPMQAMIDAALGMGAHGAFLSGAGPTVLASDWRARVGRGCRYHGDFPGRGGCGRDARGGEGGRVRRAGGHLGAVPGGRAMFQAGDDDEATG
jgi:homoserine kinase